MTKDDGPVSMTLNLHRQVENPGTPPQVAHRFLWTRVANEIVLEVGYVDLTEIRAVLRSQSEDGAKSQEEGEPVKGTLHVTHRFALTPQTVEQLAQEAGLLRDDLVKCNLLQSKDD